MIKAVIFDLDNTLLDFISMKESAVTSAVHAMIEAGLDIDEENSYERILELYQETGWENQQIFDIFLKEKTGEVNNKYLAAAIVSYRRAREATLRLYPDVQRTLIILAKKGIKLAVVSDAPSREAWMRIYYLNLHHVFDLVLTFDDIGERKPSPKGFELALSKLAVQPEEALMVGDWPERDVAGASKLGIKTIYAKYGDTFGTVESGADWDVENIYEVVGIIKSLND
ncbi:MAG: TIGR02253 family HAD-type hydrolase [Candidatus Marinimicrobia bacterium]|jgi:putative hydrolase of the HAD superfamily|nr:TIGR02253 family HAD-type hydrolase [Candidatus Neomarinimicrobiota bacterium]MDP6568965.1 TIGR02253 family HAD-type hydrolase [Candidatus Neomarinimicrobiota bacterium]MDP7026678.1 TIGR02253 family HAD-type hydrolase [Candidatus Neomarinimicrobiota bacterium]MDP7558479.1 TIGR02253 family HAD-type hydrolase [Candidatus Neomarinimicrobiota bacterium]|tara:strand:- start:534 stop:1214 length:681 start_codon:yes stop_codon:yes gene_type:complete